MPNLRIISRNVADKWSIAASNTAAGPLVATNLQKEGKSPADCHRATGTTVAYTLIGTSPETLSGFVFPYTDASPTATMQIQLYAADGTTVLHNSTGPAHRAPAIQIENWTPAQVAQAYAYGGGACLWRWITPVANVYKAVITIVDVNNLLGFFEATRFVMGNYWSPTYNVDYGADILIEDTSVHYRTAGNEGGVDVGVVYKKLNLPLSMMSPSDRTYLMNLMRNHMGNPLFISVHPDSTDVDLERDHMLWCRRDKNQSVSMRLPRAYGSSLRLTEA